MLLPRCRVIWDYCAVEPDELSIHRDQIVVVERQDEDGWWFGHSLSNPDKRGLFPGNFVHVIDPALLKSRLGELCDGAVQKSQQVCIEKLNTADKPCPLPNIDSNEQDVTTHEHTPRSADKIMTLIEVLESRARAAETALVDERRASDAFRTATMSSLEVLHNVLARAVAPLPGVLLEMPEGSAVANHDKEQQGVSWANSELESSESSHAKRLAFILAKELTARIRNVGLGRRSVTWFDFCESVTACLPLFLYDEGSDLIAANRGRGVVAECIVCRRNKTSARKAGPKTSARQVARGSDNWSTKPLAFNTDEKRLQQPADTAINGEACADYRGKAFVTKHDPKTVKVFDADNDEYLQLLVNSYDGEIRQLFENYANVPNRPIDEGCVVGLADFLRLCRDHEISSRLLTRQEVTDIFRFSLTFSKAPSFEPNVDAKGLNLPRLSRALARCALAAYSQVPTMSGRQKVDALFYHMGLGSAKRQCGIGTSKSDTELVDDKVRNIDVTRGGGSCRSEHNIGKRQGKSGKFEFSQHQRDSKLPSHSAATSTAASFPPASLPSMGSLNAYAPLQSVSGQAPLHMPHSDMITFPYSQYPASYGVLPAIWNSQLYHPLFREPLRPPLWRSTRPAQSEVT